MTPDQYLDLLREIGWFNGLPPQAAADVEANVRRTLAADEAPEPWPDAIWFDCESIQEEGDYTALLGLFVEGSYGTFEPLNVSETWDQEAGETVVQFAFDLGAKRFSRTLRGEEDWVSPDFFDLLDEAMESQGTGLVFGDVDTGDQTALFFLCNAEALDRAEEAGLLPIIEPSEDE